MTRRERLQIVCTVLAIAALLVFAVQCGAGAVHPSYWGGP